MDQNRHSSNGKENLSERSPSFLEHYLLADWQKSQPDNFFAYDKYFQRSLELLWGRQNYQYHAARLNRFGGLLARDIDPLVVEANRHVNLPKLERYDGIGTRIENVIFHPNHHEIGRHIFGSGMLRAYKQAGNNLLALSLFYLSAQLGEAGHNGAVASTAGLIKVIQAKGSAELQRRYLSSLLNDNYEELYTGAQYLTEIQGGSDVGANATSAKTLNSEQGVWLLSGEKWFSSNIMADLALITARVPGQGDGAAGIGLFLMPRELPDGQLNNFFVRRLEDKLGTRALATAEIELRETVAFQVGRLEEGFKSVMTCAINTSRIYYAVAACGGARRAYIVASTYANHRHAFGRQLIHYPLVQDMLANMRADYMASLAGTLHIIHLQDELELNRSDGRAGEFLRLAINLNKYRSAELAHNVIMKAIELLGGNGTIESFSVLPRLLRDNVIYEKWEGSSNELLVQVQRDIRRHRYDQSFIAAVRALFAAVSDEDLKKSGLSQADQVETEISEILSMDELTAAIYFKSWATRLTDLYYSACLASEGQWELEEKQDKTKLRLASLFINRRVFGLEAKDIAYYDDKVSRLCQ